MARNPEIETILAAWWELDHCFPSSGESAEKVLNQLLDAAVARGQGQVTRDQIKDWLWPEYRDYRLAKRKAAMVQIAQTALKKT